MPTPIASSSAIPTAEVVFEATGLGGLMDDGFVALDDGVSVSEYLTHCQHLRFWGRQFSSVRS
jgi:hypothetical protein